MPYNDITEMSEGVTNVLPKHAQDIYKEAFNSAYDEYKDAEDRRGNEDRETVARKVAWAAVKNKYAKGEDEKWHPKEGE